MNITSILNTIAELPTNEPIALDTLSDVKLTGGKKNPFQGRVKKLSSIEAFLNDGTPRLYETLVKSQMAEEGLNPETFQAKERPWGKRVDNTPIIEHKDQYYLEVYVVHSNKPVYLVDGEPMDKDEIEGLPVTKVSESSQGGITNKIDVRTIKLENIQNLLFE